MAMQPTSLRPFELKPSFPLRVYLIHLYLCLLYYQCPHGQLPLLGSLLVFLHMTIKSFYVRIFNLFVTSTNIPIFLKYIHSSLIFSCMSTHPPRHLARAFLGTLLPNNSSRQHSNKTTQNLPFFCFVVLSLFILFFFQSTFQLHLILIHPSPQSRLKVHDIT